MKFSILTITSIFSAIMVMTACAGARHKAQTVVQQTPVASESGVVQHFVKKAGLGSVERGRKVVSALPRAVIYKTNGDYNDYVTMVLNSTRTAPQSFPGPGDVGERSIPLTLADGWLLDRRGSIGEHTVFLKYTYEEYAALKDVPDVSMLMKSIIPEAHVTQAYMLPITANEALRDTAVVNTLIREGLPDATPLVYSVEFHPEGLP